MILSSIKMYLGIAVVVLSAVVPSYFVYSAMSDKVATVSTQCKNDKDAIVQSYKEMLVNAKLKNLEEHNKLLQDHRKITDAKNAEIKRINANLDDAISSLRNRPSRQDSPASSAGVSSPGDCEGRTGTSLSREDAEFLTREAARADKMRTALDEAYQQYDSLKDRINTMFQSQGPPSPN